MLGMITALLLQGPFAFTAPQSKMSLTLPAKPAFCVILPEAKINPDGCINESAETIAHKRKPLATVKSNALVATAEKGTLLVTVHEYPASPAKNAAQRSFEFFQKLTKREADEGRPITWSNGRRFHLELYNHIWVLHGDAEHELPDGKWKEARWLLLMKNVDVEILVQSSADADVAAIGKAFMETLTVPLDSLIMMDGPESGFKEEG